MGTLTAEPSADRRWGTGLFWVGAALLGGIVLWRGSGLFLFFDEWTFVGSRRAVLAERGMADFLLRPHNDHLMAGTVLWEHVLVEWFGLSSYVPWIVCVVAGNVFTAWVVRRVMARLGVAPVPAAVVAVALLVWPTFGWALVWGPEAWFGLVTALVVVQLMVMVGGPASPAGPASPVGSASTTAAGSPGWRAVAASVLATVAVAIHSVAVVGVVVVVVTALALRRWASAAVAAVPGVVFALWWVSFGRRDDIWQLPPGEPDQRADLRDPVTPSGVARFVIDVVSTPFGWAGTGGCIAGLLAIAALVAAVAAGVVRAERGPHHVRVLARALVAWAVAFVIVLAAGRATYGATVSTAGRYALVLTVLVLPLAALGVQSAVGPAVRAAVGTAAARAAVGAALAIALLTTATAMAWRDIGAFERVTSSVRRTVEELAASPRLDEIPATLRVLGPYIDLDVGHVRALRDDGVLPLPSPDPADGEERAATRLAIQARFFVRSEPRRPGDEPGLAPPGDVAWARPTEGSGCFDLDAGPQDHRRLRVGDGGGVHRAVEVVHGREHVEVVVRDGDRASPRVPLSPYAAADDVRITTDAGVETWFHVSGPATLCGLAG